MGKMNYMKRRCIESQVLKPFYALLQKTKFSNLAANFLPFDTIFLFHEVPLTVTPKDQL